MTAERALVIGEETKRSNVVQGPWKKPTRRQLARLMIARGDHPTEVCKQFEADSKSTKNFDSRDEVDAFVAYFLKRHRYRDALMVVIGCNMGLRISDIIMLRWKDIAQDVYKTIMKKTGEPITLPINQAVKEAAALYKLSMKREYDPDGYIFVSEGPRSGYVPPHRRIKGQKLMEGDQTDVIQPLRTESASRIMTKAAKEAGLWREDRKISTHAFRKTAENAAYGAVDGVELSDDIQRYVAGAQLAQMMAGHRSISTTVDHYLSDKLVIKALSELNLGLSSIRKFKNEMKMEV